MVDQLYVRATDELPGPLPTLSEIRAAYEQKRLFKQKMAAERATRMAERAKDIAEDKRKQTAAGQRDRNTRLKPSLVQRARKHVSDWIKPRGLVNEPNIDAEPELTIEAIRATSHKEIFTVAISRKFFVKFGPGAQEYEGRVLLYLESFSDIPTPTLYAMFRDGEDVYLVMEYVKGVKLSRECIGMDDEIAEEYTRELHRIMGVLRSIPPPAQQRFGDIYGGPVPHPYFRPHFYYRTQEDPNDQSLTGPFSSESGFTSALVRNAAIARAEPWSLLGVSNPAYRMEQSNSPMDGMHRFFEDQLPCILRDHDMVLTHSALIAENILVRVVPGSSAEPGRAFVSAIVNWECLGWYPSYWEFAAAFIHLTWRGHWWDWLRGILEPWVREAALLRMLHEFSVA